MKSLCKSPYSSSPLNFLFILELLLLLTTFFTFTSSVHGYGSGAPNSDGVCNSLIPGHGSRQGDRSPYKLLLHETGDGKIMVSLVANSQVTFAGFIVQARAEGDQGRLVDGQFTGLQPRGLTQAKSCPGGRANTWTHTSGQTKTQVSAMWTPTPENLTAAIVFRATVVQVKQAYWDQILSEPMYLLDGNRVDEEYYSANKGRGGGGGALLQSDQAAAGELSGGGGGGNSDSNGLDYASCADRACMGLGQNGGSNCLATRNCLALLTARQDRSDGGRTEFTLSGRPLPGATHRSKYFSVGLSEDAKMGDDLVVDCSTDQTGSAVHLGLSYNTGRSNEVLDGAEAEAVLQGGKGAYTDGVISCRWTMAGKVTVANKGRTFDLLNKRYHLLLAHGEMDGKEKGIHDVKTPSSAGVDLAAAGALVGASAAKDLRYLVRVHGSLMVVTWLGLVSVAIVFARYFKDAWSDRLLCGVKIWFAFHRTLMVLSVTLMVIAQLCIFYYVGGYVLGAHQIVGSIAFTFALLNPVGALFRPHPDAPNRWLFNWGHWLGGNVGQITAVAAILLATKRNFAGLPEAALYVVMAWIAVHVLMHAVFQFHASCMGGSTETSDMALHEMHNGEQNAMYNGNKRNGNGGGGIVGGRSSGFKTLLLALYVLLILVLTITLVTMICAPEKMAFL